ncbi:hypothetical protein ACIG5E_15055 [Kitasatospora sp. NPDC053057]|uniref:hypothetical protein n=1 Tax=Kitasatospora sp. NPDC053057 TaxID=3364062 RepID=UPI0037C9BD04
MGEAADPSELLGGFDHFSSDRKRLMLGTYLAVLGAMPHPEIDLTGLDHHGHATWVEVGLCAAKILNAHGRGRPQLVPDRDRRFLVERLRAGRRGVWEANVGAHLFALLAVHEFDPGNRLIHDGIEA